MAWTSSAACIEPSAAGTHQHSAQTYVTAAYSASLPDRNTVCHQAVQLSFTPRMTPRQQSVPPATACSTSCAGCWLNCDTVAAVSASWCNAGKLAILSACLDKLLFICLDKEAEAVGSNLCSACAPADASTFFLYSQQNAHLMVHKLASMQAGWLYNLFQQVQSGG